MMVVAAGVLLFGGVALAREQQTRDDHIAPAATQAAVTLDDNGVDATRSPELQASDNHGNGAEASAEATAEASDDHGNGADDSANATVSPDDNGNGSDDSANATATPDDHGGQPTASASPTLDDKTPKPSTNPTSSSTDGGSHGG